MPDTPPTGQQHQAPPYNNYQQQNRNIGGSNLGRFPGQMYQQNPPQQMNRPYGQQIQGGGMGMRNPGYYPQQGGNPGTYNQRPHYGTQQQRPQGGQFRPPMYKNAGGDGQEYTQPHQRFQNPNYRPGGPPDSTGGQQHFGYQYNSQGAQMNKGNKQQLQRRTIDYYSATVRGLELRASGAPLSLKNLPADPSYIVDVFPAAFVPHEPETSIASRFVQQAQNKERQPINIVRWTPEGRRLITGSSSGELTLWNGLTFNFETIMQAHDNPVRSMEWCHHGQFMITGDHGGIIKYWKPNFSFLKDFSAHKAPVRDVSFSPNDTKFVSASDDQQLKVWDFARGQEERSLVGHTWEVRAVDWHPYLGMIASGGKDDVINIWDPRTAKALARLARHNNSITGLQWNPHNGNWLLSGGRDHCIKLFDVRKLKEEIKTFATTREIHSVAWHPVHETLFATGGSICNNKEPTNDGTIQFWLTDDIKPKASVERAHFSYIWSLAWNPMGHILASGSNDRTTKFWCRPRPAEGLPTELGGNDVDERIFGKPVNALAAAKLASGTREQPAAKDSSSTVLDANATKAPGTGGLPGLQSADIGRMLAKIKMDGVIGLPGLGNKAVAAPPANARPPLPSAGGLPGLSRPSNLPGPRPPPPPPLSVISASPLLQQQPQGPVRNQQQRQSSRFNPIQRNQPPPPPPPPSN
ncbi:WD repeat-containing protein 33 [Coemansia erecta]|nr:WD repeat-containing protein 33 [Coemansia erecta]